MKIFSKFFLLAAFAFSANAFAFEPDRPDSVTCASGKTAFTEACVVACHNSFVNSKYDNAEACTACRGGVTLISAGLPLSTAVDACKGSDLGSVCVAGVVGAALACGQTLSQ